ncbi:2Fe-2S iron-sulfur cluster-binding protein [Streptomyces atratus]|uniref:2Fe-2S iron-sulfur cluster-binding protein n=1 Tax=Streptomyces atratus TaxID=1893 RepID=UPI003869F03E
MSNEDRNDQHGQQEHLRHGSWQPTPQGGEYDADATAFVHLPPEDLANIPLAAPGQGYVPPMILPLTPAAGLDPSATGSWVVQPQSRQEHETGAEQPAPEAVHWPDPNQQRGPYDYEYPQAPDVSQVPQTPHDAYPQQQYGETHGVATGQWNFTESTEYGVHTGQVGHAGQVDHTGQVGHAGQVDHTGQAGHVDHAGHTPQGGHTGQWTIPVADGDLPEESGEFAASALAAQWYGDRTPPATLPGGAPAPWATQQPTPEPQAAPEPVSEAVPEPVSEPAPEPVSEPVSEAEKAPAPEEAPTPEEAPATPSDNASASDEAPFEHSAEAEPEPGPEQHSADQPPEPAPDAPQPVVVDDAAPAPSADTAPPEAQAPDAESPDAESPDAESPDAEPLDAQPAADLQPSDDAQPDAAVQPTDPQPLAVPDEHPAASYVLHVNGADRPVTDAWIGESLLYVLRERLGLAGAKDGCSQGECGACNVQVDGRLVASCLVPAATAAGSEVRTVEGLAVDGEPSDVQRALTKCGAVQCGFCIPGMAMTVHDLLEGNHAPSELETRQALCGNLCRCSGYRGVLDAVNEVIAGREATIDPASSDSTSPEPDEARIPHQAAPGAGSVQSHPQDGGMA